MSYGSRDPGSRFVRALVRSARADASARGATARARARLGVGEASPAVPFGFAGALLLVAATLGVASGLARVAPEVTVTVCWGGAEAPPCSGSESSSAAGPSWTVTGSSSGTDSSHGGNGG